MSYSTAFFSESSSGQINLFGAIAEAVPQPRLEPVDDWMFTEKLSEEHQSVGFYLSGHPIDEYLPYLLEQDILIFSNLKKDLQKITTMVNIIGIVVGKQERQSSRGNRFAFVQFSDPAGSFEVTVFSDVLERSREMFEIGQILVLLCEIKIEGEQVKILLKGVQAIEKIIEKSDGNGFRIFIESIEAVNALVDRLGNPLPNHNGNKVPLNLVVVDKNLQGDVEIKLAKTYSVNPDLIGAIKHIDGVVHVERMS